VTFSHTVAVGALALLASLALVAAPTARAQCEGPPGEGAIDEYCETIPGPGGDQPTGGGGGGSVGGGGGGFGAGGGGSALSVPSDTTSALEQAGGDGQRLLAFTESGSGSRSVGNDSGGADGGGATIAPRANEPADGTLGAVPAAVDSAPMSEGEFVLVLVAIALGLSAVALYRRRSAGGP
jgi:hypothetical protein